MGIAAVLASPTMAAEPGTSVACDLRVANDGPDRVVVRLDVTGPGRPFSWVAPESVVVEPGGEAVARVGFHLPRASEPAAGPLAFAVDVHPADLRDTPLATVRGSVEVAPFSALSATLAGPTEAGGGRQRYELTVGNRGNAAVATELRAESSDDLDLGVTPSSVVVAPGSRSRATVDVAARGRPRRDAPAPAFRVVAEPEVGDAVTVDGRLPAVPGGAAARTGRRRRVGPGVLVALVAVVAVVAGGLVLARRGKPARPATVAGADDTDRGNDPCPAKDHGDSVGIVRGLQPDEIAKLPNTFSFLRVAQDGCHPVRFNPCEPVHYIQNAAAAPPAVADNVREAFARLSKATGITFVDDGLTDETTRSGPYVPNRYGSRWAPILIVWERFPPEQTTGVQQILGNTVPMRVGDVVVSARLRFNLAAYNDEVTQEPIQPGFGPEIGSGTGPIGRKNIQWGRIVLHELAHVVGLGHTRDEGSIMYPDAAQQTARPADFKQPDLLGLRYLGRDAGCLASPPLPAG